ncbi:MAG: ATP:cob(I)alamin adenosyltransferase [Anaerolinea sp.]|nr:ATP:cob(I)alamin adenosyltransferase [Anaerolinea sp.]
MKKSKPFTGLGDEGTSGLLGEGRFLKSHFRFEVLGSIEELSAILGLVKSALTDEALKSDITNIQSMLYGLMAQLSVVDPVTCEVPMITDESVHFLEKRMDLLSAGLERPAGFIIPGDSMQSALVDYARTFTRRVERRIVELDEMQKTANPAILPFINRLSSYLFVLELYTIKTLDRSSPTMVKK